MQLLTLLFFLSCHVKPRPTLRLCLHTLVQSSFHPLVSLSFRWIPSVQKAIPSLRISSMMIKLTFPFFSFSYSYVEFQDFLLNARVSHLHDLLMLVSFLVHRMTPSTATLMFFFFSCHQCCHSCFYCHFGVSFSKPFLWY